jgi:hypothetical protein
MIEITTDTLKDILQLLTEFRGNERYKSSIDKNKNLIQLLTQKQNEVK